MSKEEYVQLVKAMRNMQNEYFKTRSKTALMKAKKLEQSVDRATAEILKPETKKPNPGFIWL